MENENDFEGADYLCELFAVHNGFLLRRKCQAGGTIIEAFPVSFSDPKKTKEDLERFLDLLFEEVLEISSTGAYVAFPKNAE